MKKHEQYKNSGVEWLGEVPVHWEVKKFKHIFSEKKKTTNISLPCGSISFGKVIYKDDEKIPESTKRSYQVLSKGDFLINPLNLNYDLISLRIALSDKDVVVSSGYIILNNNLKLNKDYFKWLLHVFDVVFMKTLGSGVRQTLSFTHISNCELVFPSLDEQNEIANFLDDKTDKIDQAIAIKQKQIELLKERRQILIHKAVTRGLNENVKLKDSGVEWIGEIPEHWEVKRLKYIANLVSDKMLSKGNPLSYIGMENIESWTGNYVATNSETEGLASYFKKGDILFGKLRPYLAKVHLAKDEGICTTEFLVYRNSNEIFNWYLHLLMLSFEFINLIDSSTYGSKMPRANSDFIGNQLIPIPLKEEQTEIAKFIETATTKIATAISLKEREIEKMKEYKMSLIDGVVTGKVRVC